VVIARIKVLLPFVFHLVDGEKLRLQSVDIGFAKLAMILPPMYCDFEAERKKDVPFFEWIKDSEPPVDPQVKFDGKACRRANLLIIDQPLPDNHNRDRADAESHHILVGKMLDVADAFIRRFRSVLHAPQMQELEFRHYLFEYLKDDGTSFPADPAKIRLSNSFQLRMSSIVLFDEIWNKVSKLPPDYEPLPFDRLLLDAEDRQRREPGVAAVLSHSAIETIVSLLIECLIDESKADRTLWDWVLDRDQSFIKTPSIEEKIAVVIPCLGGKSLKDNATLWQVFKSLKSIRNNFVHRGLLSLHKSGEPLAGKDDVFKVVAKTGELIQFFEEQLPAKFQRPIVRTDKRVEMLSQPLRVGK
jgi:hypothetical protein